MNETTRTVRELYEQFPYPSGTPTIRLGFDARYLLSLSEQSRKTAGTIRVLDAGCGRALGLIGAASLQPDIDFLGVDLNRVALAEAEAQVSARGLKNLRLLESDLEQLDLEERNFDIIHSSGVIHHLTDPSAALRALGKHLAPHGVIALMVYGQRDPMQRVAAAIQALTESSEPLVERLAVARELVRNLASAQPDNATWKSANEVDDAEFVDRYLHPCEQFYDIDSLFDLIDSSGLAFMSWADSSAWNPAQELQGNQQSDLLAERLAHQSELDRYKLALSIHRPGKLELYVCKPGNRLRQAPAPETYETLPINVHPEVTLTLEHRGVWCESKIEKISTCLRGSEPVSLSPGPVASAAVMLATVSEPFLGRDLMRILESDGLTTMQSRGVLTELFERELIYTPHLVDISLPGDARVAV